MSEHNTVNTGAGMNEPASAPIPHELEIYRAQLDVYDAQLIHLLALRKQVTDRVGELKARVQLPQQDIKRESEQEARIRTLAKEAGIEPDFAHEVHMMIVNHATDNHRKLQEDSTGI